MNQRVANRVNSVAVAAYKLLGTVLLGLILVALLSFLSVQGFFLVSRSWVTPTIISPTDPQILQLNTQAAHQTSARDEVLSKRRDVENRLADAERTIATERSFQERFKVALRGERQSRQKLAQRLSELSREYATARGEIVQSNRAFSGMARVRTEAMYDARLLAQEDRLTMNHHLAQIAQSNLSLAQNEVDLQSRLESLHREGLGLEAVQQGLGREAAPEGMTSDVLLLEREYTHSVLEQARAEATRKSLEADLKDLSAAVTRFEQLLTALQGSPYLKAIERNLNVAFVPYENLANAQPGTPLYLCAAKVIWCREVGVVGTVLEGEVSMKHPIRQYMLRGVMVELQLAEPASAQVDLLHLGRPPLLM